MEDGDSLTSANPHGCDRSSESQAPTHQPGNLGCAEQEDSVQRLSPSAAKGLPVSSKAPPQTPRWCKELSVYRESRSAAPASPRHCERWSLPQPRLATVPTPHQLVGPHARLRADYRSTGQPSFSFLTTHDCCSQFSTDVERHVANCYPL